MSVRVLAMLSAVLGATAVVGCGARTTLDQDDYLAAGGALIPGGGSASGGSAVGGSSPRGGTGGSGNEAGTATAGSAPVGGTGGLAGAAGKGGVGGDGGGDGRGQIKAACETFCGPYSTACPMDAGTVSECTWSCMSDFGEGPRHCREITIDALNCLGTYFDPSLGCDQALLTAVDACFDLVQEAQDCNEFEEPQPPPPPCGASGFVGEYECSTTLMCEDGSYYVDCYALGDNESECNCSDPYGGSGFVAEVPVSYACDYAIELCGYPY
jgi:hypothetical protein